MAQVQQIAVNSLSEARENWSQYDLVISIQDRDFDDGLKLDVTCGTRQFVFVFDDADAEDGVSILATREQIAEILKIGRALLEAKTLVHCHQGKSRSAAVALALISDRLGAGREEEAVSNLLAIRPSAVCNQLVLRHADEILNRQGALLGAWNDHLLKNDRAYGIQLLKDLWATQ